MLKGRKLWLWGCREISQCDLLRWVAAFFSSEPQASSSTRTERRRTESQARSTPTPSTITILPLIEDRSWRAMISIFAGSGFGRPEMEGVIDRALS